MVASTLQLSTVQ